MDKIHKLLLRKNDFYVSWHDHKLHKIAHWALLVLVGVITTSFLLAEINPKSNVTLATNVNSTFLVNVRDEGATGNGVTDDSTAIERAIARVNAAGGGTVYFPPVPGNYNITRTLELSSNTVIQGCSSAEAGTCQIRLTSIYNPRHHDPNRLALFSIRSGTHDVVIRDIELRSSTEIRPEGDDGPPAIVWPRANLQLISIEGTSAVRMHGRENGAPIENITLENLRIADFNHGIDAIADSVAPEENPSIRNVKIRSVSMVHNYIGLNIATSGADNWDMRNLNLQEIGTGQNGVNIDRSGLMIFTALSCASTPHDADTCVKIYRHGRLAFNFLFAEGLARSMFIGATPSPQNEQIILRGSSLCGLRVEGRSNIVSLGNGYSNVSSLGGCTLPSRYPTYNQYPTYSGAGISSSVQACEDLFYNPGDSDATHARVDLSFTGLSNPQSKCSFDPRPYLTSAEAGSIIGVINTPGELNVRNYGALGDGTTDDSIAIQHALDDARTRSFLGGATVVFPQGTYRIQRGLQIKSSGTILQGDPSGGSILSSDIRGRAFPLLQIKVEGGANALKRGIAIRDLNLNASRSVSNSVGIDISGNLQGALTDLQLVRLNISGFSRAIQVKPDSGNGTVNPMLDSIAIQDVTLTGNNVGLDIWSNNAANFVVENLRVLSMTTRPLGGSVVGVRVNGGGFYTFKGLRCEAANGVTAEACLELVERGNMDIDGLSARGVNYAIHALWNTGYFPANVHIRNSDLRAGVAFDGQTYLVSTANQYEAQTAHFNIWDGVHGIAELAGDKSSVFSCGDSFTSGGDFTGLAHSAVHCPSEREEPLKIIPPKIPVIKKPVIINSLESTTPSNL